MKKQAKTASEPIVLSGRVYFKGFLADIAGSPVPEKGVILRGDLRLHNVSKQGSRPRFGSREESFEGFYSASVYDGKNWRRLLMRQHAAVDATYSGAIARRDKAASCKRHLETLRSKVAVWDDKESGFLVSYNANRAAAHVSAPVAPAPVAAAPASAPAAPAPAPVAVSKPTAVSAEPRSPSGKTYVKPHRRPRKPKAKNSNQGELF